jgi:hypothetical protein
MLISVVCGGKPGLNWKAFRFMVQYTYLIFVDQIILWQKSNLLGDNSFRIPRRDGAALVALLSADTSVKVQIFH